MTGACDKSLIIRCVTRLAFSFVVMASVNGELSTSTVKISVAELKRSSYNQVTLSSEDLRVLNSVICLGNFILGVTLTNGVVW